MNKPNFFIVGAPKCGTTALSEYLRTHPNIFMSSPKEPHFFAPEVRDQFYQANTEEEYLKLFEKANGSHKIIGEASVMYLYFENSLKTINEFDPEAKLIVMLRNPIDLAYSWHSQAVYNTDEDVLDFKKAWGIQENRRKGINIPTKARMPFALQYKEIASLGTQVKRLLDIFPKEQIHFILMDDFKKDVHKEYLKVLKFLDVKDDSKTTFPVVNQNKVYKNNNISRFKRSVFADKVRILKKVLGLEKVPLMAFVDKWNITEKKREPLSPIFRSELLLEFISEIELLEKLLNKDLSAWKK